MAITYQSSQTTSYASGTTVVITKPTGLAVGDLMVACIQALGITAHTDITCSGWTTETGSTNTDVAVLKKTADSSDVAASNFTFDLGGTYISGGAITRITNGSSTWTTGTIFNAGTTSSPVFTTGITPSTTDSLMLMFVIGVGSGGFETSSAYAITTNNPSWTEAYDIGVDSTSDGSIALAYANRPESSATGNFSATCSGSSNAKFGLLISVPELVSVTVSPVVIDITASIQTPSIAAGATVTVSSALSATTSVVAPTVSFPQDDWTNQSKNSSTWTNQDKS